MKPFILGSTFGFLSTFFVASLMGRPVERCCLVAGAAVLLGNFFLVLYRTKPWSSLNRSRLRIN